MYTNSVCSRVPRARFAGCALSPSLRTSGCRLRLYKSPPHSRSRPLRLKRRPPRAFCRLSKSERRSRRLSAAIHSWLFATREKDGRKRNSDKSRRCHVPWSEGQHVEREEGTWTQKVRLNFYDSSLAMNGILAMLLAEILICY